MYKRQILNWRPVAGAAYYNVHRTNATNGQKQKFVVPKGTAFKDLTAESGNSYWHAVVAVSSDGEEGLWPCLLYTSNRSPIQYYLMFIRIIINIDLRGWKFYFH